MMIVDSGESSSRCSQAVSFRSSTSVRSASSSTRSRLSTTWPVPVVVTSRTTNQHIPSTSKIPTSPTGVNMTVSLTRTDDPSPG